MPTEPTAPATGNGDGWTYTLVPLPDGRTCEVLLHGRHDRTLVHQPGTPSGAAPDPLLAEVSDSLGLRVVIPLRPGYGRSTPNPGRRMADVPGDIEAVLAHLGVSEFVSAGYSGGGPHSLATAALASACRAAAVVVSPAPRDAAGLDYYAGMAASNFEEWALADQGEPAVRPWLEKQAAELRERPIDTYVELFGDALPAPDRAVVDRDGATRIGVGLRKALENGIEGWLEDDIALTTPWGFDLTTVTTPVTFWSGRQDAFISYAHTLWMAQQVSGSDLHLLSAHGHLSLMRALLPDLLGDLVTKAGWS
ncbi:alpha/beta hydrolase [Sphaerisporangium sp. NPDC051011]|uniref:alpha/beta fold hydrolase n=1 Tax=Sphaerisporangium sp. NPDC051011 TaxID=3155792 RepID=UPI0033D7FC26